MRPPCDIQRGTKLPEVALADDVEIGLAAGAEEVAIAPPVAANIMWLPGAALTPILVAFGAADDRTPAVGNEFSAGKLGRNPLAIEVGLRPR